MSQQHFQQVFGVIQSCQTEETQVQFVLESKSMRQARIVCYAKSFLKSSLDRRSWMFQSCEQGKIRKRLKTTKLKSEVFLWGGPWQIGLPFQILLSFKARDIQAELYLQGLFVDQQ